jgi:CO/xanthine dehydrogenase Mo-binding subunit
VSAFPHDVHFSLKSRHEAAGAVSILGRAARSEISVTGESSAPLEMLKFSMHSRSAIFCELRVSEVTGEVRMERLVGSFDCGRILNPKNAASQFRGGMIMGIGMALTEETLACAVQRLAFITISLARICSATRRRVHGGRITAASRMANR